MTSFGALGTSIDAENAGTWVTPTSLRGEAFTGPTRRANGSFEQTGEGPGADRVSLACELDLFGGEALPFDRGFALAGLAPPLAATASRTPPSVVSRL